ncbi:hypothetical protein [Rubrolithibacter danxiaensis]|uniref:hypothetical protein n=1 Tax=Rubrolithibacter danxiaensis TaxID=3390805 RepID=UPI003BF83A7D
MLKGLSYHVKNKLLLVTAALLLILSWIFAFSKTVDVVAQYRNLTRQHDESNDLSYNPEYLNRKKSAINTILKRYQVDSAEWKNEFWLNVSSVASNRGIAVIYSPDKISLSSDSSSNALKQKIQFLGQFKPLVALLDSLEKTPRVGKITSVSFEREKKRGYEGEKEEVILKTAFTAIVK